MHVCVFACVCKFVCDKGSPSLYAFITCYFLNNVKKKHLIKCISSVMAKDDDDDDF